MANYLSLYEITYFNGGKSLDFDLLDCGTEDVGRRFLRNVSNHLQY